MTDDGLQVRAGEYGRLRVFALDYQLSMELAHFGALDRLERALGVPALNGDDVQIVQMQAIRDIGLSGLLREGYEIPEADLAPQAARLDALEGTVALIRSGAFGGQALTLAQSDEARLVTVLTEPGLDIAPTLPLPAGGAAGVLPGGKPGPSQAAIMGRVAMVALLVIFALTALMVWIAG